MSTHTAAFSASYAEQFAAFLAERDERHLRAAYELGRQAIADELSVLDLAVVHHDVLAAALADSPDAPTVTGAASDFLLEALSAYEMVRRGFREAREAAAMERRQTALLRQLSNFLADASLALGASDTLAEMLQLVAEQARELMNAVSCVVRLDVGGGRSIGAASPHGIDTSTGLPHGDAVSSEERDAARPRGQARTMNEPLRTLGGDPVGSIEVSADDFNELDAAVLVQLAQMASAAIERRQLYRRP